MSVQPTATSPDQPASLNADEVLHAVAANSNIRRLLQLDGFWTREAQAGGTPTPDRDARVQALAPVVEEMVRLLGEIKSQLPSVRRIFESHASEIAGRFAAVINPDNLAGTRLGATLSTAHQDALRTFVEQRAGGDIVALLTGAVDTLDERADPEADTLTEEFRRLRQTRSSQGDVSEEVHHAAHIIEAGLALAGQPELAVLVEAGVQIAECLGL
jgi:hypothetical protein